MYISFTQLLILFLKIKTQFKNTHIILEIVVYHMLGTFLLKSLEKI